MLDDTDLISSLDSKYQISLLQITVRMWLPPFLGGKITSVEKLILETHHNHSSPPHFIGVELYPQALTANW